MKRLPALSLVLLAWGLAAPGCESSSEIIPVVVATPEGQNTFDGVTTVRVVFGEKEKRSSLASSNGPFEVELELPKAESSQVLLEGLDSADRVLCRGRSPYILAVGSSESLVLYVARLGTFGRAPGKAPAAALGMAAADYRVEDWDGVDDDTSATVFFGGITTDGTLLSAPFYYDTYFHRTYDLTDLPAGRRSPTALNIDGAYFLVFGGWDETGALTGQLDLLAQGAYTLEWSTDYDYGLTGAARAEAPGVRIGPYSALMQGSTTRLVNSFVVAGGQGPAGPRCDALHLLAMYDLSTYQWIFRAEPLDMAACRRGHTVTMSALDTGDSAERVVLIYGGAPDSGDPVAETLRFTPTQVDVDTVDWGLASSALATAPGPMITGHTALTLPDGRVLILGGETTDGTTVADGWLYDPEDDSFTGLPDLLQEARSGHTATLLGDELVVAGGRDSDGAPLANAEVFDLSGDTPEYVDTVPFSVARSGHFAFAMPTGTLAILGGVTASGAPTDVIEIYTPGLLE